MRQPTFARLQNSMGKVAVAFGIDRYLGGLITADPRLFPTAKLFYSSASRHEIWEAATIFYAELGWGPPVALAPGVAVGSMVTPTENAIKKWFAWMEEEVNAARPARRYSLERLLEFHNKVALACASLDSFFQVLRARHTVHVSAMDYAVPAGLLGLTDKRVGRVVGNRLTILFPAAATQRSLYIEHCDELDRRLDKFGIERSTRLRIQLQKILGGKDVPAYFTVGPHLRPRALGTVDLAKWWPAHLCLEGNFARHYMQTALRRAGVKSTDIDAFVRHTQDGNDPWSSTGNAVPAQWVERVATAAQATFDEAGIEPVPGLRKRS